MLARICAGARFEHLAVDHHGDGVGDGKDGVHVVLDEQDRARLAQALEHIDHLGRFLRAHAGQRLVEEQHLGVGGQHHGDLELALLAVAEHAGQAPGAPARPASAMQARALSMDHCCFIAWLKIRQGCWRRDCAARRTFSSTVNLGKMLVRW
jgi:hypothetical protein